jgi:nicotinate-nucleotide pyrophosphorylase (carboxylating)
VIAGQAFLPELIDLFAPQVRTLPRARDGDLVFQGQIVLELDGPLAQMLALERTMLNLVGRLSGIATRTRRFVDALPSGVPARIYDTRKTTPGLRLLEKYAVRAGGGRSHRMGLHDAVLIKDNHIAGVPLDRLAQFIHAAAARARAITPAPAFIQVEVDSLDQFDQLLTLPARTIDIVLLDNMGPEQLRRAVAMRNATHPALELEASGGVTLETLPALAATGVNRISIGGLTHSAVVLDVALDMVGQA